MREHARPLFASATHPVSLPPLKTTMPDLPRTRRAGPAPSGEVLIKVPPERAVMTPTWELLEHVKGERERAAAVVKERSAHRGGGGETTGRNKKSSSPIRGAAFPRRGPAHAANARPWVGNHPGRLGAPRERQK